MSKIYDVLILGAVPEDWQQDCTQEEQDFPP